MSYKFYQLPDDPGTYLEFPLWIKDAIATRDIRVTADGEDVYVRTPVGEVRVDPTDYIVRSSRGNIFVLSEELFENLVGIRPPSGHTEPAPEPPSPTPNAPLPSQLQPQPSSGVLARSARARAQASHSPAPTPSNAHVEGADTPDEPTPTPAAPTSSSDPSNP
jgi:hypothetical protein